MPAASLDVVEYCQRPFQRESEPIQWNTQCGYWSESVYSRPEQSPLLSLRYRKLTLLLSAAVTATVTVSCIIDRLLIVCISTQHIIGRIHGATVATIGFGDDRRNRRQAIVGAAVALTGCRLPKICCNLFDKKLSYRRETARQLHTSFSAHSLIVHFTEHRTCFTTI